MTAKPSLSNFENGDIMTTEPLPPEPGTFIDLDHGIPGDAEEKPDNEPDESTAINDEEDEE